MAEFTMATAKSLHDEAFEQARTPRSEPYKAGVLAALRNNAVDGGGPHGCKHAPGTAEFDAFFAGMDEGRDLYHKWVARMLARRCTCPEWVSEDDFDGTDDYYAACDSCAIHGTAVSA